MSAAQVLNNAAYGRTSAWPDSNTRPDLQTLRGRFLRRLHLSLIYGLWVLGTLFNAAMWVFSLVCVAQWVWSTLIGANEAPIPLAVQVFLSLVALYESYHFVTRPSHHPWPFMRRLIRYSLLHYPYFRLNATVFDERERAKQLSQDGATNDTSAFNTEIASKTIVENDISPFVKPNESAMFAFHPHSVLSNGWVANGANHMSFEQADCRWLVAENLFGVPLMRDLLNWMDFSSVAKSTFQQRMSNRQNVCLIPGGFEEATLYERGKHRVYIKKRFGFIKLALQYGYKVHPVYTFGEEYAYHTFPYLLKLRLKLNEFKIPGVFFFGLPHCFFLPRTDVDLITVVGEPLVLPRIEQPTKEDVQKYQGQYVEALQKLFNKYKSVYAVDPQAQLEIY
ncbi:Diacylglycerol acyltransferase domain-containing protein [Phytophthora infestans]|uniref:Acyltransferase n=1 Tax=Phytophthora infestans TaxID=4787 RepID=A0A833T3L0_PHYIN|nr:Diacylglycerol acyltransferase domain-containing protein [Phytophthora infestans]KAF4137565.1 Diacylglycerol acyltransferase domain-containing protein [Phytophthora infestans]